MRVINILGHTFLPELLPPEPQVADLGGNRGEFAKFMIHGYGGKVFLYEPLPELFREIPEMPGLTKFPEAVTVTAGDFTLRHSEDRCATVYAGHTGGREITVPGVDLATVFARMPMGDVDLVKMDVEGAEMDILENANPETLRRVRQMTVEFHDFLYPDLRPRVEDIKSRISRMGFYVINFSYHTNGDILFLRRDVVSYWIYLWLKYVEKYIRGASRILRRMTAIIHI